jgi:prolyl-tRNA editing enzyme YbaK/EbsC (Cys-tRNA(Pro) deacylase)
MNQNVKRAIEILKKKKFWFRIIESEKSLISSKDVENFTDVNSPVCKTIVMRDENGKFFAAFLLGSSRVDLKKVQGVFGCSNLRLAKAKELKERLHFAPGEACPLLLDTPLVIDNSVLKHEKVNFGSGDVKYGIEMNAQDILKCLNAKIDNISE